MKVSSANRQSELEIDESGYRQRFAGSSAAIEIR
jgi:hypothetical protein